MTYRIRRPLLLALLLMAGLAPASCAPVEAEYREVTAERIARPAFMVERRIAAKEMDFQLWERTHKRSAPANLYIEGDGYIIDNFGSWSDDPTPKNPVALALASEDNAKNVLYISRPCQFRESQDYSECAPEYWLKRRFSPEVIAAYNDILDELKARWDITEFNLIGHGGGANIAAALAAVRSDVTSLRTVAGILNPASVYPNRKGSKKDVLDGDSVTALSVAPALANMPQRHFLGASDSFVTADSYNAYRSAMGASECIHYTNVAGASYDQGWKEQWYELLKQKMPCPSAAKASAIAPVPSYMPYQPTTELPPVPVELRPERK